MNEKGLAKAKAIVDLLSEKKGEDILLLDLIGECSFTDYFVICSGPSARTLRALSDEVRKLMKDGFNGSIATVEGEAESGWILLDYGDVVLHLFSEPVRRFYGLEELWDNGQVIVRLK
jgi:ribosome-associated protein